MCTVQIDSVFCRPGLSIILFLYTLGSPFVRDPFDVLSVRVSVFGPRSFFSLLFHEITKKHNQNTEILLLFLS